MNEQAELQQILYHFLTVQIEFGTYHYQDRLPTIEEAGPMFLVSADTVRSAYLRLKQEGYITLSRNRGAIVNVQYTAEEIDRHVQDFFLPRKEALIDLGHSMGHLFGKAQLVGLQAADGETLDQIENLMAQKNLLPLHRIIRFYQYVYGALDNELLMHLVWQTFMFYHAPFLSIPSNGQFFELREAPLLHMAELCRKKNWTALETDIMEYQDRFNQAVCRFFDSQIHQVSGNISWKGNEPAIPFRWSSYKKSSQLCYSLGMDLLIAFNRELYPAGSFLPSLNGLASEYHVSVSTVRRMLALLNSIGLTKSINGVGTRFLHPDEIRENCDLSQPALQRRLKAALESLQIYALSSREVLRAVLKDLDEETLDRYRHSLCLMRDLERYELAPFVILNLTGEYASSQTVRTVYQELFQQLMWAYPLRSIQLDEAARMESLSLLSHFLDCLDRSDFECLAASLETFLTAKHQHLAELVQTLTDPL